MIVDPANPVEVIPTIESLQSSKDGISQLSAIINTHHHGDHAGGNGEMLKRFFSDSPTSHLPQGKVIGGKDCQSVTTTPDHGSRFNIGEGIEVTALHTPCHTMDSICYYMEDVTSQQQKQTDQADREAEAEQLLGPRFQRAVFTGDTLFIGGCGRFFEGTPDQMHQALNKTLASLPDDTKVFPGHEYTRPNISFLEKIISESSRSSAASDNEEDELTAAVQALKQYVEAHAEERALRHYADKHERTPFCSTIGNEKKHNVFMRVDTERMKRATGKTEPSEVMGKLREMKNNM